MSLTFECGDKNALVAYLYEECEPDLRAEISGHLTRCESCSSEIDGLGWTRRRLEVWTPPMPELGFQMSVPVQEARLPWWRAPLPAWAQAAAAIVIFGVGLSVGLMRDSDDPPAECSSRRATDGRARSGPVSKVASGADQEIVLLSRPVRLLSIPSELTDVILKYHLFGRRLSMTYRVRPGFVISIVRPSTSASVP